MIASTTESVLVAHRGYPERFPENTLPGLEAALRCGARAVEFDVQLTVDRVPVLFHDEQLLRITGKTGSILETGRSELQHLSACEPRRFGRRFAGTAVATLEAAVRLLAPRTETQVFVEIKLQSLRRFGMQYTVQRVLRELGPIADRCIVTSFSRAALVYARQVAPMRTAWALPDYGAQSRVLADTLQPDILAVDIDKLPDNDTALWRGGWQWMLYVTNDPLCALKWSRRGADYVETNDIGRMQGNG